MATPMLPTILTKMAIIIRHAFWTRESIEESDQQDETYYFTTNHDATYQKVGNNYLEIV
jgi:hypothetical protein